MKDSPSMMLSSLTVGDKQHPKLGGCVGVFLQLFDWNRRLSSKRFFSQKQLPAERPARHASKKVRDDNSRVPMGSLLLIADKNREGLQTNDCNEENYMVNLMALSEGENSDKHKRRPGVVARLMGLESFPAPDCYEKKEASLRSKSTVHVEYNSGCERKKIEDAFALEHGLPDEKIKVWLDDFDGSLTTNLSVLHTHKSIASSCPPATTRTSVNGGTSSPTSPCPATTPTTVNFGISSPSSSSSCPPPPSPRTNVDMGTSSPAFEHSLKALSCGSRRQHLGKSSSAKSLKSQLMCTSGDGSDLDQANYQRARVNGDVGSKGGNMIKVNDSFATKRISKKVNYTNNSSKHDGNYMKINGKSTCKKRRSKADLQGIALQITEPQEKAANNQPMVFVNQASNYGNCRINSNGIIANQSLASNNNINDPGCYYKSKSKVAKAASEPSSINGHLDDSGRKSKTSKLLKEAAQKSAEPASKKEEFSLMKILVKRRAAREASAAAAIEAAGLMDPPEPPSPLPAHSLPERREKLSAGRSEGGGVFMLRPSTSVPVPGDNAPARPADSCAGDFDRRQLNAIRITVPSLPSSPGGVQLEICGQSSGKTTAAILQDVICALNARTAESTSVSGRPADDDGGATPSTAEGQDSESTSDSMCWAGTSQPSPVSVLVSPFDDEALPAGDHDRDPQDTWHITSEEDYVAAILAATSEGGPSSLSRDSRRRAELFRKLEARVVAGWPDSEVPPTRGYRLLIFDCVREALEEAVGWKGRKDRRRWQRLLTRVLHSHIRGLGRDAGDLVLDDLVDADLRKPVNRWSGFETETGGIVSCIEHTLIHLLVEELVCDLVLA